MTTENKAAPVPGSAEYDAAMIALADAQGVKINVYDKGGSLESTIKEEPKTEAPENATANITKVERPAHVPEKFWNAEKGEVNTEAWAQSTSELESKLTQRPVEPSAEAKAATEAATAATAARAAADAAKAKATADGASDADKAAATKAEADAVAAEKKATDAKTAAETKAAIPAIEGVINKAGEEFAKDGKLTEESYAAFEKNGISRETVNNYIEGEKAKAALAEQQQKADLDRVYKAAGGDDKEYAKVQAWAKVNLPEADRKAFDSVLQTGNIDSIILAAKDLRSKFDAAHPADPKRTVTTTNNQGNTEEHYASTNELTADMNSAAYRSGDKAFHAKVDRKIQASERLGIALF